MRIAIAKEAFNRKIPLLTSMLNIKLRMKLVWCYVWSIALYGSENWTQKYLESFEMWCWRRMEKIKCSEKVTNEEVLESIEEKDTSKQYPMQKSQLDWSYSENKLPSS